MRQRPADALHAREAYDALAPHYDDFTAHHDHAAYAATLLSLAREHGLEGRRLLDVACGTGESFLALLEQGFAVTACDLSPEMVARAARKAPGRARVEVADMRALPQLGTFDLVWCLDDAVNYLLDEAELVAALDGLRRQAIGGGLVLFDVNSLISYRTFFASLTVLPREDRVLVWDGLASEEHAAGDVAEARLEALERAEDRSWRRTVGVHRQRHYPEPVVRQALEAAQLELLGVYGMQLDGSLQEGFDDLRSSKAVFVARA
jgi:SAM-dependent methyltransferase